VHEYYGYHEEPRRHLVYFWCEEGQELQIPTQFRPNPSELPTIDLDLEATPIRRESDGVPLG
jgi:hypothetical protein